MNLIMFNSVRHKWAEPSTKKCTFWQSGDWLHLFWEQRNQDQMQCKATLPRNENNCYVNEIALRHERT